MNAKALVAAGALSLALAAAVQAQTQSARRTDPLATLPAAVTIVMQDGVMLVENEFGVSNSRTLKVGDEYRDGWKLEAVTATSATLKKGGETRTVNFERRAASAGAADALGDGAAGQVNLSNAVAGERSPRTGQVLDRAKLQAAVKAGDLRQAYELGGSAKDVADAMATSMNNPRIAEMLANGGQASFVNMNGNTGVRVSSSQDGRAMNVVMAPPQLQGVAPPADAEVMTPPPMTPGSQVTTDGQGNTIVRRGIALPAPGQ